MRAFQRIPLAVACGLLASLGVAAPEGVPTAIPRPGLWRATLASPGGELPFGLVLETAAGGGLAASVLNGPEKIPFTSTQVQGRSIKLRFDYYDSEIVAEIDAAGDEMHGTWTKQADRKRPSMPFTAALSKGAATASSGGGEIPLRFGSRPSPPGAAAVKDVSGGWDVVFKDEDGVSAARGEFSQSGSSLLGTFLTPTGDYRYLAGDYGDGILRLSCFDGGHAFLFIARAAPDGTLAGDFWSRGSYHATWTAKRGGETESPASARGAASAGDSSLPDPFAMTALKSPSGKLRFSFPDLDGRPVSLSD